MLRNKNPSSQKKGNKSWPTLAHAKATWISELPLANQIHPLIKPYQTPTSPIPSKFHSIYPIINQEIGFSPIITKSTNL